ncbi:MAG: hypothetical protein ABL896_11485, partial [Hylemonella sp.]
MKLGSRPLLLLLGTTLVLVALASDRGEQARGETVAMATPQTPMQAALMPSPASGAGQVNGAAEARLIEIYRLTGAGYTREALERAESLVRDHPNFQLAQLVYGDLLTTQARPVRDFGDVPAALAGGNAGTTLSDLR